eukprot:gene9362-11498_t
MQFYSGFVSLGWNSTLNSGSGNRNQSIHVTFPKPFVQIPLVTINISNLNVGDPSSAETRIDVVASNINVAGFDCVFSTWVNNIVKECVISFTAYSLSDPKDSRSLITSTMVTIKSKSSGYLLTADSDSRAILSYQSQENINNKTQVWMLQPTGLGTFFLLNMQNLKFYGSSESSSLSPNVSGWEREIQLCYGPTGYTFYFVVPKKYLIGYYNSLLSLVSTYDSYTSIWQINTL